MNPKSAWLARLGYAARGVVYVIVGTLAALAAVGRGGRTTDTRGALHWLVDEPWGKTLLVALGAGLLAFAISRAVQAVTGTNRRIGKTRETAARTGLVISAAIHTFLAAYAVSLAFGWGFGGPRDGGDGGAQSWSAWALSKPAGQVLLASAGFAIVGVGVSRIVMAWLGTYRKWLALDRRKMKWADPIYKAGLIAHGVVFVLIGVFVVVAAYQANPGEARGFGGALRSVQGQPYGTILLLIVALGLIAFGASSVIRALYGRIGPPE